MSVDLVGIDRLAAAIGLVDGDGALVGDWFSRPGDYLSSVLADDAQRHSWRGRAMIVVLWRAGLRIQERSRSPSTTLIASADPS